MLVTFCVVFACGLTATAQDDPVEKKLATAKEEFEKSAGKARSGLLADLKKREETAQKAGDLKALEKVLAEAKAFEDSGELPKSVPLKTYESQMRMARAKLEEGYGAAVKQYTKDGKLALAKAVQQDLDEFKKGGPVVAAAPRDPFMVKSVWVNDNFQSVLTVTERKGEKFTATFVLGDKMERVVTGSIKDGKISWLSKDVRAVRGNAGGDNHGTLGRDKIGDKIDFVWRQDNGANGTFTLRLSKGK
jgi:hypothetical protein